MFILCINSFFSTTSPACMSIIAENSNLCRFSRISVTNFIAIGEVVKVYPLKRNRQADRITFESIILVWVYEFKS